MTPPPTSKRARQSSGENSEEGVDKAVSSNAKVDATEGVSDHPKTQHHSEKRHAVHASIPSDLDVLEDLADLTSERWHYYAAPCATRCLGESLPALGFPAEYCQRMVEDYHTLDFKPRLNTSSYVNVVFEKEEEAVSLLGASVNLADQTVYPQSFKMHNDVLNMLAHLWNCPKPACFDEFGCFPGAGTVGSTEACLLAGLCLKLRWRKWYAARHKMDEHQVRGVYPNLVISTLYQACWEKLFKYMDVEPHFVIPSCHGDDGFKITAEQVREQVDEKTIGVICVLGNHYGGQYDPVLEISDMLEDLNAKRGLQVGIHVDGASGGFIAPFQPHMEPFDFRVKNVLSMSASGHKFGESVCGTGWIIWRERKNLSEHVAISVSYLGGRADSFTLNFSRPASGVYVQYYKFLRLGMMGYRRLCINMMKNAKAIRDGLKSMKLHGKPRFLMLDDGDEKCLPVVAAMLNPELKLAYDDIDLQHAMSESHWYVSGYKMRFNDPANHERRPLFSDMPKDATMFRIVVKSNLTYTLVANLLEAFETRVAFLDSCGRGYQDIHDAKKARTQHHNYPC